MPEPSRATRSSVVVALVLGLILGAVLLGAIGFLMLSRNSGPALLSHAWSAMTGRTLIIDVSQPTVVNRIQQLQRLETVVYTMDKVVSGAKENPIFPDFLAGDRLLLLVHGEVVAGIDFSSLKPGDVKVEGKGDSPAPARDAGVQLRGSTAPGRACIPGRPACWSPPIQISNRKCVRRRNAN